MKQISVENRAFSFPETSSNKSVVRLHDEFAVSSEIRLQDLLEKKVQLSFSQPNIQEQRFYSNVSSLRSSNTFTTHVPIIALTSSFIRFLLDLVTLLPSSNQKYVVERRVHQARRHLDLDSGAISEPTDTGSKEGEEQGENRSRVKKKKRKMDNKDREQKEPIGARARCVV